ncbi:putative calcium/calmodulin-dependent protein kinase [Helianthus annuus]|uniref:Calcium/calmodulin-dependent protein kinase n=1 Tax=Helianthus annuus TaxID=4232 RepID=A0A251U6W6_HELAN|nr:uncharacterized protein LOC110870297 [Helianthus annuus]KAF5795978.1 putative calcium/calmodulin-dependent protein kinase [Helianthus annuus]KAJ0547550.1 putative calcium/calmodulin-dependent protein kinase [Helianthus annuus]KAJ0554108.1 putative calcium/calmodulin-dependent protein kinase [Helianthus annuus]KAJ0719714.1 putative calcium/calmodulin-dependent protein kinase [Helianthus annuus]KAJ0722937.1 putative calcium/calmodulin-dependent protein kinase [Helianthus annuus]
MQQFNSDSQLPVTSGDRKTACDTLTVTDPDIPDSTVVELPPDFPPESFWLSKDAEFDWFDRNAFLDRNDSTKGNANSTNFNQIINPSYSISSSQRYLTKSKAAIIGLPKPQNTTYVDSKRRHCKPVNVRLFPSRSYSVGRGKAPATATVTVTEPSSPKVTCIGRVRSKRRRSRRKSSVQPTEPVKSASQRSGTSKAHRSGLLSRITALFRSDGNRRRKNGRNEKNGKLLTEKVVVSTENSVTQKICVSVKPVVSEPVTPSGPPGLGGMIRFASGHRSGYDVAGCGSLEFGVTSSTKVC